MNATQDHIPILSLRGHVDPLPDAPLPITAHESCRLASLAGRGKARQRQAAYRRIESCLRQHRQSLERLAEKIIMRAAMRDGYDWVRRYGTAGDMVCCAILRAFRNWELLDEDQPSHYWLAVLITMQCRIEIARRGGHLPLHALRGVVFEFEMPDVDEVGPFHDPADCEQDFTARPRINRLRLDGNDSDEGYLEAMQTLQSARQIRGFDDLERMTLN